MGLEVYQEAIWVPSTEWIKEKKEWVNDQLKEIGEETLNLLADEAVTARNEKAYAPHSGYLVGAAILCKSEDIYSGGNLEYYAHTLPTSMHIVPNAVHAEEAAIHLAISEGEIQKSDIQFIKAIIVSHPSDSGPCDLCLPRIIEHCDDTLIIDVNENGEIQFVSSLSLLKPKRFSPKDVK